MAFENSIGQAIALGSLAHPDASKPFTNAVMNKQKLDLVEETRKAKEAAAAKKLHDDMSQRLIIHPEAVLPIYQKDYLNTISGGMAKAQAYNDAGNRQAAMNVLAQTEARAKMMKGVSDENKRVMDDNSSLASNTPQVRSAFYDPDGGIASLQEWNKANPHNAAVAGVDPNTGIPYINNVKQIDQDTYFKGLNSNANEFIQPVMEKGQHKFTQTANSRDYQYQQTPAALAHKTEVSAQNKDLVTTIALTPEFSTEVANVSADPKYANLPPAQQEDIAMKNIIYRNHNKIVGKTEGIHHPPVSTREPKKPVNFTPVQLGDQDNSANVLLGPGPKMAVEISTPTEGENKNLNLDTKSAIVINGDNKTSVDLTGRPVTGKVVRTLSGPPDKNGNKQVYVEVHGKALTNGELGIAEHTKTNKKDSNGDYIDDEKHYKNPAFAAAKPDQIYYIPARNVLKNIHSEFSSYANTNTIEALNKLHGINYSDLIPGQKSGTISYDSGVPKTKKKRLPGN